MTDTVPKSGRHRAEHLQDAADAELVAAVRGGDTAAFGVLYHRHQSAARRLARVLVRDPSDAEDLVAEAMTRVLAALRTGRGPSEAFRAYLLTAVRHACYDRARRDRRIELTEDFSQYVDRGPADPAMVRLERSYAARAFARLPERWRLVLWHTEVEGERPATIAPLLGLTPTAVAALAYRAREGLRQMYLQEHLADTEHPACRWTASRLAAHVRGRLPRRDRAKVDAHLASCAHCRTLAAELAEVNAGLRGVLGPIVLGTAAGPYLASISPAAWWTAWWVAITGWLQAAAAAVRGWFRRLVERYGGQQVAAGAGLAAAGLVGLLVFTLTMVLAPDRPDPREPAPPPVAEPRRPIPAPVPAPSSPRPETPPAPAAPAAPVPPVPAPEVPTVEEPASPSPSPGPATPIAVAPELATTSLAGGSPGTLAVTVTLPGDRREVLVLRRSPATVGVAIEWPDGLALAGPDGGDGWQCEATGTGAECRREAWRAGQPRTLRVPVTVDPAVAGFAPVRVTVESAGQRARAKFQVPVAPVGMRAGYAASGRYRMVMAGNTWLTCRNPPACFERDNNDVALVPYLPHPPAGLDPAAVAASGATLGLPAGAEPAWAGLFWATTSGTRPDRVLLHNGAAWFSVRPERGASAGRQLRQGYADVTELVRGGDPWWVATTGPVPTGKQASAGWSLVVVYEDPDAPRRDLAVFVDPVRVPTEPTLRVTAGGAAEVGLVLWEGDRYTTGDTLADGRRVLTDNVGRARASGALEGDRHTFGVDVATYRDADTVTLHTGQDLLDLGVLVLAV